MIREQFPLPGERGKPAESVSVKDKLERVLEKEGKEELLNPEEHLKAFAEIKAKQDEERRQVEEGETPKEESETKIPPRLRWHALHLEYVAKKDDRKKKAFEGLEAIAWLENDIFEAKRFLEDLKKEGTYDPKSPAVIEAEKILQEHPKKIEEIKKANPDIEDLWLKPRREEYEKRKEGEAKRERVSSFIERIETLLKEESDYGDLITSLNQAVKGGYLETYSADTDNERVKKLLQERPWDTIRVGKKVYIASDQESAKQIFRLLKKLEAKNLNEEQERKEQEKELKKRQNLPIERMLDPDVAEGSLVYIPVRSPIEVGEKRYFVRGGILFESAKSEKGNIFWRVIEINGNVETVGITKKNAYCAGFTNAPKWLRNLIQNTIENSKTQPTDRKTPSAESEKK